jgi:hypothetical protein
VVGFLLRVFWVLLLLGFSFSFLVVLVYTPCVRRGALRFLYIIALTYQKKKVEGCLVLRLVERS